MNADSVMVWQKVMAVDASRCISLKISFNPRQVFIWGFLPQILFRFVIVGIVIWHVVEVGTVRGAERVRVNARAGAINWEWKPHLIRWTEFV
jgi:hypothetical protein